MRDGTAGIGITAGAIVSDGDNGRYEFHVGDGVAFLQNYPFHGGELVYCDPPYLHSTRRDPGLYRYEMADTNTKRSWRYSFACRAWCASQAIGQLSMRTP